MHAAARVSRFHDGAALDANDVVLSYAIRWDAAHPLHHGREGTFQAFADRFGGFLHPPARRPPHPSNARVPVLRFPRTVAGPCPALSEQCPSAVGPGRS